MSEDSRARETVLHFRILTRSDPTPIPKPSPTMSLCSLPTNQRQRSQTQISGRVASNILMSFFTTVSVCAWLHRRINVDFTQIRFLSSTIFSKPSRTRAIYAHPSRRKAQVQSHSMLPKTGLRPYLRLSGPQTHSTNRIPCG